MSPTSASSSSSLSRKPKNTNVVNLPETFRMERILKKRMTKKKLQYLIKWDGYESSDNTWEPAENIIDKTMLDAFEASQKEAARIKKEKLEPLEDKENEGKVVKKREAPKPMNLPVFSSTYSESTMTSMLPPGSTIAIKKEEKPLDEVPNIEAIRVLGAGYDEVYKGLRYLVEYEGGIGHLLTSDEIKERHPQLLLDFFEKRFKYSYYKKARRA